MSRYEAQYEAARLRIFSPSEYERREVDQAAMWMIGYLQASPEDLQQAAHLVTNIVDDTHHDRFGPTAGLDVSDLTPVF